MDLIHTGPNIMPKLEILLETNLPKNPLNKDHPKQILRRVRNVNTGKIWSLMAFCAEYKINYQGCIEQINRHMVGSDHETKTMTQVVEEMRERARAKLAKLDRVHDCPRCRCVRSAEEIEQMRRNLEPTAKELRLYGRQYRSTENLDTASPAQPAEPAIITSSDPIPTVWTYDEEEESHHEQPAPSR